ncbi:MAG: DUF2480 family protein [Cytophagales bacterium]|nr:MAG: DUF2480 family protein [Cytophagales bacterium]
MDEIINKVANSSLITIDLEDYYNPLERLAIDLTQFLYEGTIIREKYFRELISNHDWNRYTEKNIAVYNTSDAIIPLWAYMIIVNKLAPVANFVNIGSMEDLNIALYTKAIFDIDPNQFTDKRIVIKGCGTGKVPIFAYGEIVKKLSPVAQSIMFGEPCSTVPVYKRK